MTDAIRQRAVELFRSGLDFNQAWLLACEQARDEQRQRLDIDEREIKERRGTPS